MTPKTPTAPAPTASLQTIERRGLQLTMPLQRSVQGLTITDEESYLQADSLLGRIVTARRTWEAEIGPILRPLKKAIDAAKEAMLGAKKLDAKVDGPLGLMESQVKLVMRDYKIEEARQIREAEDAREQERRRLDEERRKAELTAAAAKPNSIKARLADARTAAIQEQEQALDQQEESAPVKGSTSTTRTTKSWRITDKTLFLKGILLGKIPDDMVSINTVLVGKQFRDDPTVLTAWPGIELYDDVSIVRR